jgi:polyphenol oxidase
MQQKLKWQLGNDLVCYYSQKSDGCIDDIKRKKWLASINNKLNWVILKQKHQTRIIDLDKGEPENHEADAIVTSSDSWGLTVWGSDCPGVGINCGDGVYGIAHCGWRGTAARLPFKLCEKLMEKTNNQIDEWTAFVGPGISKDCYEIDSAVMSEYQWPRSVLKKSREGHAWLDLKMAIHEQLYSFGIRNINVSDICTATNENLHSYRKSGRGANQLLAVCPL